MNKTKTRDYLFDNYKTLLIFLVVIGHFIEPCFHGNAILTPLKWGIVSFHMPAFIFISGYFSKRELPIADLIRKLLIPYLVYEIVYFLFYTYVIHKKTELYLCYPKFSLWYLLALFVWRVATPYVKKLPHHFLFSIVAGLAIGCSNMEDNFLSIPRILVFYPFFLAGMYFNRETLTKLRTAKIKLLSMSSFTFCILFVCFGPLTDLYSVKIFYGRYNYASLGQSMLEGILCRTVCYVISFVLTYTLMLFVSERKHLYSYVGTRTMGIYLFHGLAYNWIKEQTHLLDSVNTVGETFLLLTCCIGIGILFSMHPFTTFTNKIANLRLPTHIPTPSYLYAPHSLTYLERI